MMSKKLLIAGGGTGGHIFPGIAIAQEWIKNGGDVLFVGTPLGQEVKLVPQAGFTLKLLNVGQLKGHGILRKIKTLLGLPKAFWQALMILKQEKPDAVLGIGGYASGPLCLMASFLRKNTAVTDQNAQPGITNRILGKFVKQVFLSFEKSTAFFQKKKTKITGNPVRSQISWHPYAAPKDKLCLFVFGGSQGAVSINQNFLQALERLQDKWQNLEITHQAGKTDIENVKSFYDKHTIPATVSSFFDNMDEVYQKSHLVICRSGAGTVTELATSGRPALFIPYPFAADNHQLKNAEVFVEAGAAWLVEQKDLSPEVLEKRIRHCFANPEELKEKAERMKTLAKPDAAREIVKALWE